VAVIGCAGRATPVSRAVVTLTHPGAATPTGRAPRTLLVLPTTYRAPELVSCFVPGSSSKQGAAQESVRVPKTFAELIDPLLRIKLELAGFTLADAEVMRLDSPAAASGPAEAPRTLAVLPSDERREVAAALGLEGIVSSELLVRPADAGRMALQLAVELRAFAGDWPVMTVRCEEVFESPQETGTVLANCVGNGVLAAVAPDALLGRLP